MLQEALTKEQEDAVLKEVGYTRQQLEADLVAIKEWLKKQHHLPPSRLTEHDFFLTHFLSGCKGKLDKVKKKLDAYYSFRSHSEIFENRDPSEPEYQAINDVIHVLITRKPSKKKLNRTLMIKLADTQANKFDCSQFVRKLISMAELRLRSEPVSVSFFVIFDAKDFLTNHVVRLNHLEIADLIRFCQDILPMRLSKMYFINVSPFLEGVLSNLILPFLTKKLKEKVIITVAGSEVVRKEMDKSSLPKDYGGNELNSKELSKLWHEKEVEKRGWFLNELSEKCDESKRIIQDDTMPNPYLEMQQSMKNLNL